MKNLICAILVLSLQIQLVLVSSCSKIRESYYPKKTYYDKYSTLKGQENTLKKIYELKDLTPEKRNYYADCELTKGSKKKPLLDKNGVLLFERKGKNYYHPVVLAQKGVDLVCLYRKGRSVASLEKAKLYADAILDNSVSYNGALYFPYHFDFNLHSYKGPDNLMKAPWYSGMAQGQVLSFFIRLYDETNEIKYLEFAKKIIPTFVWIREDILRGKPSFDIPWISYIDDRGYFWIEEYPQDSFTNNTLNGKIFAIYGLYDYYVSTKDPVAKKLLNDSLQTVEHYLPKFRATQNTSYYNLKYKVQSLKYHKIHLDQIRALYTITGDKFFKKALDQFTSDTET